jgi:hypothetical protein
LAVLVGGQAAVRMKPGTTAREGIASARDVIFGTPEIPSGISRLRENTGDAARHRAAGEVRDLI